MQKENGKLRYRRLNIRTVKSVYALPRVEDIFDCLYGSKSCYHQVEMEVCFYTWPSWFWEFNKLPFSLVNSPPKFQRIIEDCLGSFNMTICIVHLDNSFQHFSSNLLNQQQHIR